MNVTTIAILIKVTEHRRSSKSTILPEVNHICESYKIM